LRKTYKKYVNVGSYKLDTPLFGTQYSGGWGVKAVRSTQRASTQYATIPLSRTQRSKQSFFKKSFSVISIITDENITQRLKMREWQINNIDRSQWYD